MVVNLWTAVLSTGTRMNRILEKKTKNTVLGSLIKTAIGMTINVETNHIKSCARYGRDKVIKVIRIL